MTLAVMVGCYTGAQRWNFVASSAFHAVFQKNLKSLHDNNDLNIFKLELMLINTT